ncbi:class I SAM-dependent methyltransferase, partial [Pseudomonas aeruginosa]
CDPQRRTLEEEREFWRCYARVYDQHAGETGGSLAQIAAVTEIVEPGSSVLDVGGGTGRFAIPLAQRGCRVTVLDRSEDMLSVLESSAEEKDVEIDVVHQEWPAD